MNDPISRQEALDAFGLSEKTRKWGGDHSGYNTLMLYEIQDVLEALPSAEPVKHEECEYVITKGKAGYHEEYKCSVCGDSFYWTHDKMFPNKFNYCRNCGRKIVKFIDESKG